MASDVFSKIERELLLHSNWVRRLARSLVANEADADELVQDTWVAALRRPSADGAPARPWLARVVRNLAARRWRRNEVALETPEALSSSGAEDQLDSAERLETQRILVEELQALADPARRVILLRYFDGLDAAEIARRTGEPAGTVRWRLHDALAELRTRLDRRHGGTRGSWMRALTLPRRGSCCRTHRTHRVLGRLRMHRMQLRASFRTFRPRPSYPFRSPSRQEFSP